MTSGEQLQIWQAYQKDRDLRAAIISFDPFLSKITRKLAFRYKRFLTRDDVRTQVEFGFYQSLERFVPESGSLIPFATRRITGAVIDLHNQFDPFTAVDRREGVQVQSISNGLTDKEGRSSDVTIESIDASLSRIEDEELWKRVFYVLTDVAPKPLLIINLLYREGWTPHMVARYFSFSPSYVSGLKRIAIDKIAASPAIKRWLTGTYRSRRVPKSKRDYGMKFLIPKMERCCEMDCDRPVYRRGRCSLHKQRTVDAPKCSVDGCDRPATQKGMCSNHRRNVRRRIAKLAACV